MVTSSYSDSSIRQRERRVPRAPPMLAMTKRRGEERRTARFMMILGSSSLTAYTWPMDTITPRPTSCQERLVLVR